MQVGGITSRHTVRQLRQKGQTRMTDKEANTGADEQMDEETDKSMNVELQIFGRIDIHSP